MRKSQQNQVSETLIADKKLERGDSDNRVSFGTFEQSRVEAD
jgi:hypothetical protein